MKKEKLYLSGPMSAFKDECYNFESFLEAGEDLLRRGYEVLCPARAELARGFNPCQDVFDEERKLAAIRRDIEMVLEADAICLLDQWEISDGVKAEIAAGAWAGKNGYFYQRYPKPLTTVCLSDILCVPGGESPSCGQDEDILIEALRLTTSDRQAQYGPPNIDFARTAKIWTALFADVSVYEPFHVSLGMIALKSSRAMHSPEKRDNWTDMAGYARCGHQCVISGATTD